nr:nucleotide-binding protein [Micromonospora sp. DSM 115978]
MEPRLSDEPTPSPGERPAEILVFDTSPLTHFARQNWLGVLKAVVGERQALIPDVVVDELRQIAASDSRINAVLQASWLERRELRNAEEISAFARFSALLVRGERNKGEAGVLALASTLDGIAVIDDGAGRKAARTNGVLLKPTLALLCEAIRQDLLTIKLVSALVDDLLVSEYRLPFEPGGFEQWATENHLFSTP